MWWDGDIIIEAQHQPFVQVGNSTGRIELEQVWQTNLSVYSRVKANVGAAFARHLLVPEDGELVARRGLRSEPQRRRTERSGPCHGPCCIGRVSPLVRVARVEVREHAGHRAMASLSPRWRNTTNDPWRSVHRHRRSPGPSWW